MKYCPAILSGEFYFISSKARYFIIYDSEWFHILRLGKIFHLYPTVVSVLFRRAVTKQKSVLARGRNFFAFPIRYSNVRAFRGQPAFYFGNWFFHNRFVYVPASHRKFITADAVTGADGGNPFRKMRAKQYTPPGGGTDKQYESDPDRCMNRLFCIFSLEEMIASWYNIFTGGTRKQGVRPRPSHGIIAFHRPRTDQVLCT